MILTMEGTMYPTLEDEYSILALEPTHSDEDEAYYTDEILSGNHDEDEADREGIDFSHTDEYFDEWESRAAGDRWERAYWGD